MAINRSQFAEECAHSCLHLGVHLHYVVAMAEMRSQISEQQNGDKIGPFQFTQSEWNANSFDEELGIKDFVPEDIGLWEMQCTIAALMARHAQDRFLNREGSFPSAVQLYQEQWSVTDSGLSAKFKTALDATATLIKPALLKVLEELPAQSPVLADADKPAPPTEQEFNKPVPAKGEQLFLAKAPRIMEKLIHDFDLKPFQAAGILGNIGLECDGFRLMQEVDPIGGGRGGFGWCQWTGDRRKQFENFCVAQGLEPTSDAANYGYLKRELQTSESASIVALKTTTGLIEAVHVFEQVFERAKAGLEHFDRRERWAKLALDNFREQLPAAAAKLLDPDLIFKVAASAVSGTTSFWAVDQFAENGGQVLIAQKAGQEAKILDQDTTVLPVKPELIPDPIPAAISDALSAGVKLPSNPHPKDPTVASPATDLEAAQRVFVKAQECDETLITRDVKGTKNGRLACAYAVNEVVRRALGKPIGGGFSTTNMSKVLSVKHTKVDDESKVASGVIIISPTQGENVGHVGIVSTIKSPLSATTIYSNSSSRGVFSHKFTVGTWKNFYRNRKGLPVLFFALDVKNLGK